MAETTETSRAFTLNKIHKFEQKYCEALIDSIIINELCKEVWVFGSTVNGISKEHRPSSDIDLAILPKDITLNEVKRIDLSMPNIVSINNEICRIIITNSTTRRPDIDIIWLDENFIARERKLMKEIWKGVKLI